jgi:prepilin-type N-terminal cleavage/methylation domain-containing protein
VAERGARAPRDAGLSLIELVVTLAVLAMLATAIIMEFLGYLTIKKIMAIEV